jgi:hypothetical protein
MFSTWKGGPDMGAVSSPQTSGPGGSASGPGGWHPTVLFLLCLTLGEIVAVALLSRHLLK